MGALYKGFWTATLLAIPAIYGAFRLALGDNLNANIGGAGAGTPGAATSAAAGMFTGMDLFYSSFIGLAVTALIVWITEYYTGTNYRPVQSIARASPDGPRHEHHPGPWRSALNSPRCRRSSSSSA